MKKLLLPSIIFFTLMSCSEEEVQPRDHFSGSWYLSSPDVPVEISFDVVKEGRAYNYYNTTVNHPAIAEDQRHNNRMVTYDPFIDGNGYGRIEITARGPEFYRVTLIYNRFSEEGMSVYDVQIDIPSEPFIVIPDQVFVRK
jgi:hypothetical protein